MSETTYNVTKTKKYKSGSIKYIKHYLHGKLHNDKGPAHIRYDKQGKIILEEYYILGKLSRLFAPAKIKHKENGEVKLSYYYKGLRHNKYGPAVITIDKNGNKKSEIYYFNDKLCSPMCCGPVYENTGSYNIASLANLSA